MPRSSRGSRDHKCAAPRCERTIERGQLMCRPHWFALPKGLRDEVMRTWRRYNGVSPRSTQAWLDAHGEYALARSRAVEYLAGGPDVYMALGPVSE